MDENWEELLNNINTGENSIYRIISVFQEENFVHLISKELKTIMEGTSYRYKLSENNEVLFCSISNKSNFSGNPQNRMDSEYQLNIYTFSTILMSLGIPDEINISIYPVHTRDVYGDPKFNIMMYYQETNTLFQYLGLPDINENDISVCFSNSEFHINSWNKSIYPDLKTIRGQIMAPSVELIFSDFTINVFTAHTFEEAFSLSVEDFVLLYSNPDYTECLTTPVEIWKC